jgi:hypothetical protein
MKGDAWAVKRYMCPRCSRKGLYVKYQHTGGCKMGCMYKKCDSNTGTRITWGEVHKANPELITSEVKYKP